MRRGLYQGRNGVRRWQNNRVAECRWQAPEIIWRRTGEKNNAEDVGGRNQMKPGSGAATAPVRCKWPRRPWIRLVPLIAHTGEEKDLAPRLVGRKRGSARPGLGIGEGNDHPGSHLEVTHAPVLHPAQRASVDSPSKQRGLWLTDRIHSTGRPLKKALPDMRSNDAAPLNVPLHHIRRWLRSCARWLITR